MHHLWLEWNKIEEQKRKLSCNFEILRWMRVIGHAQNQYNTREHFCGWLNIKSIKIFCFIIAKSDRIGKVKKTAFYLDV